MSVDPNRLLFVISAHGIMAWKKYCEAVDFLSTPHVTEGQTIDSTASRSGLLQCLVALGHCDVHFETEGSSIIATPPALCRLPRVGLPIAVLTGARCIQTKKQMEDVARKWGNTILLRILHYPGPIGLLPDTILVESESEIALGGFCAELQIRYAAIPPAWTLVNWCGTLSEYEGTLDYRIPKTLDWKRYDFNANSYRFTSIETDSFPRYSLYRNPTTGMPLYVFFGDSLGAEVDLSWGRYLFLNAKVINAIAYDEKRFRLCVPVKIPLPSVVARTVCLCSGKPPVHLSNVSLVQGLDCQDWLMFEDVPPQIAMVAASKLGQSPTRVEIR